MKSLCLLLALAACGSSSDATGDDDSVDAPPSCTPSSRTLAIDSTWTLRDANATSLLASRKTDDGALRVALLDEAGPVELAALPGAAPYAFKAALADKPDGTRCAVGTSGSAGVFLACEGAAPQIQDFEALDADHAPIAVWHSDGTLSVFAQTYSAFTELRLSPAGAWTQIEQYESSISYPTDAAATAGDPVVCFISSSGYPTVLRGGAQSRSTVEATTCHLAVDGSTAYVVVDNGFATAAGDFTPSPIAGLTDTSKVVAVIVRDGAPNALVLTDRTLSAVALPTGEATPVATASASFPLVTYDARANMAVVVSTTSTMATVDSACP